jgi:hypothetical protein
MFLQGFVPLLGGVHDQATIGAVQLDASDVCRRISLELPKIWKTSCSSVLARPHPAFISPLRHSLAIRWQPTCIVWIEGAGPSCIQPLPNKLPERAVKKGRPSVDLLHFRRVMSSFAAAIFHG